MNNRPFKRFDVKRSFPMQIKPVWKQRKYNDNRQSGQKRAPFGNRQSSDKKQVDLSKIT